MKKLTFKKLLAGEFDKSKNLDGQLRNMMGHFGWIRRWPVSNDLTLIKILQPFKPIYARQKSVFYEGGSEWNKNIKQALKDLGRI